MKSIYIKNSQGEELEGEFQTIREAYEHFQEECDDSDIVISRAFFDLNELRDFASWWYQNNEVDYHYEDDVVEYGYDENNVYRAFPVKELVLDNLPKVFDSEDNQDMFEIEIKKLVKERMQYDD